MGQICSHVCSGSLRDASCTSAAAAWALLSACAPPAATAAKTPCQLLQRTQCSMLKLAVRCCCVLSAHHQVPVLPRLPHVGAVSAAQHALEAVLAGGQRHLSTPDASLLPVQGGRHLRRPVAQLSAAACSSTAAEETRHAKHEIWTMTTTAMQYPVDHTTATIQN